MYKVNTARNQQHYTSVVEKVVIRGKLAPDYWLPISRSHLGCRGPDAPSR